ncbi:MAG: methyltransferase [Betaproteobacteria bacterium]|nr:methyltransferase [Betaproteobacteria bacterium]
MGRGDDGSPMRLPPLPAQLLIQVAAAVVALAFYAPLAGHFDLPSSVMAVALVQGGVAAAMAWASRQPRWWRFIHLAFGPLLAAALAAPLSPWWGLAAFAALALVFWRTDVSRVPLFFSSTAAAEVLAQLLPRRPGLRVLDAGCGIGTVVCALARARPDVTVRGIEHAPLPAWLARLRTRGLPGARARRGDFWREDWSACDLVYAFLSPHPMARVWEKACREMRPGTLLVSNSFPVPDVAADEILDVADRRATRLYCYRIPAG